MNKKQKLRNAVILGLLMSSVTASSAWAKDLNVENIEKDNSDGTIYDEIAGILGDMKFNGWPGGTDEYDNVIYDNTKVFDNIIVTVKNNYNYKTEGNNKAVGVTSRDDNFILDGSNAVLKAENNITVNVVTRNTENGYGVLADDDGKKIDIISSSGTIQVSTLKTNGQKYDVLFAPNPGEIDYSTANVYGISAYNNGTVNFNAGTDIIVTAGYDKDAAEKYTSLKQGDIYGISNTGGTVYLKAGNVISIAANSANGDAYGIIANSDNLTTLNSKYNQINAVADGTGTAIGIKAENGSNVDITGDTYVHGDDGALVIQGNNGRNDSEQVIVKGNLFASADTGTVKKLTDGASEHITGNLISASGDEDNASSNISLTDGSSLTVDGYAVIQGGYKGLDIINGSNVILGKDGVSNYIYAGDKLFVENGEVNKVAARAVEIENGGSLTLTGAMNRVAAGDITVVADDRILANENIDLVYGSGYSYNIKGDVGSEVKITGDNNIALGAIRVDSATDNSTGGQALP